MAIDTKGNAYEALSSTVIQFPLASGPASNSTVVYTSANTAGANFSGMAVSADGSTLFVTEGHGSNGIGNVLFQCSVPCSPGTSGNPTNITTSILGNRGAGSTVFGPLAVDGSGTLYVALGNSSGDISAQQSQAPIALTCTATASGYACAADNVTFPLVAGDVSPFIGSAGIAGATGNALVAAALTNDGDTTAVLGPAFFSFLSSGSLLPCFGPAGSVCQISLLPSVPTGTPFTVPAYSMAIGPAGS